MVHACTAVSWQATLPFSAKRMNLMGCWFGAPPRFGSTRWLFVFFFATACTPLCRLFTLFPCCLLLSPVREEGAMMMVPISFPCVYICVLLTFFSRVYGTPVRRDRPSLQNGLPSVSRHCSAWQYESFSDHHTIWPNGKVVLVLCSFEVTYLWGSGARGTLCLTGNI